MAEFATVLDLLRETGDKDLSRILIYLRKAYRPPPKPVQGFAKFLTRCRRDDDKALQLLLDELTEQYVDDNPDPDQEPETRKARGLGTLQKFLKDEKDAGRPRPNRKALEAHIRKTERISDRQLQADLVDAYAIAVAAGLVAPRA